MKSPALLAPWKLIATLIAATLLGLASASAALVTYTNNDPINTSSFTAGTGVTNWDSGQAPAPGNNYLVSGGRTLRTPTNGLPAAAYTFGGDSLTLGDGTNGSGSLLVKGSSVLTFANLILTNGTINNGDPGVTPKVIRLGGVINVLGSGLIQPTETNRFIELTATLGGSGSLTLRDRGGITLSGAHSYNGPMTITGLTLDMDGTVSMRPAALSVGKDSSTVSGRTNFYGGGTNIVRAGGSLNVGYGPAGDLRVGWRTSNNITNNPTGVLDVSAQSQFAANVGNFIVGYSQAASAGTPASALGLVYLATNNTIVATNIVLGDTVEGTHPSLQQLVLGAGSNYIDTPIMVVGARKQRVSLTLPAGGTLLLTNSASGRADLTVGANNVGTSANPVDLADLSGGPLVASLGALTVGQKSGGNSGGVQATLTLAANPANVVNVNDVFLGSMAGNASGTTSASGTLNLNGGTFKVNNSLTLGTYDYSGFGIANGTVNLNAGTLSVGGSITDGGGNSTVNVNGGRLNLAGGGSINVDTLVVNGTVSGAGSITVGNLNGTGVITGPGFITVTGVLSPGSASTAGTLSVGSLTLDPAATLLVNLTNSTAVGGGVNDLLQVNGDINLNNASLAIAQLAPLVAGDYRLADYTGELIGTLQLPAVGRYTLSLVTDTTTSPRHLNLRVSGSPFALRWGGQSGLPYWDIATTVNWTNLANGAQEVFYDNDSVLFDDSSFYPNVTLYSSLQPGGMTFRNSANNYYLSFWFGQESIGGIGGLTKEGTGALYLGTSNSFTGPTAINGGLVVLNNTNALGATNGSITIAAGGTLDVNGQGLLTKVTHVQGSGYDGNGAIINNSPGDARNAFRNVVLDGPATFGGLGRWDIRGDGNAGSAYLQGGTFALDKVGANNVVFTAGCDVNAGAINIHAGTVTIETASTINPDFPINVADGAILAMYRFYGALGRNVNLANNGTLRGNDSTSQNTNPQNTVGGTVTCQGACNVDANSSQFLNLNGPVTGPGQLVKTGGGTVVLNNPANNWSGGTTISNGTLSVGNGVVNGSLPAAPPVVTNYGTLMYNVASNTTVTTIQEITGTGGLRKIGDGTLAMTASNSFAGPVQTGDGVSLSGGLLRLLNRYAFGDPSISKTVQIVRAEVRLEGGMDVATNVYFQTSANAAVTGFGAGYVVFRNVAGTNRLANPIELIGGAGNSEFASDAGLLVFDGPIFLGNTSARSAVFSGLGDGAVNGVLRNDANAMTVEKRGPGTWTLTADNTYTGPTIVSAGTLFVNGSIGGTSVTVQNGGTLSGQGTINSPVTVQTGGTLSPGVSVGTLTIATNLTLQGKALMEIGRDGATLTSDQVTGVLTNTYGGTLLVTNVGTSALQPGDTFKLFSASYYAGAFTSFVYPAGYVFTNNLAVDGTIGVASVVSGPDLTRTNLGFSISGTNLTLTWPASHIGWYLQTQTNTLGVGLVTDAGSWFAYPGSSTTNQLVIPINPANPSVFFRLAITNN